MQICYFQANESVLAWFWSGLNLIRFPSTLNSIRNLPPRLLSLSSPPSIPSRRKMPPRHCSGLNDCQRMGYFVGWLSGSAAIIIREFRKIAETIMAKTNVEKWALLRVRDATLWMCLNNHRKRATFWGKILSSGLWIVSHYDRNYVKRASKIQILIDCRESEMQDAFCLIEQTCLCPTVVEN